MYYCLLQSRREIQAWVMINLSDSYQLPTSQRGDRILRKLEWTVRHCLTVIFLTYDFLQSGISVIFNDDLNYNIYVSITNEKMCGEFGGITVTVNMR
jgi:hypothetical protein